MDPIEESEELQQILQEDPSNLQARRRLAMLLLENGFNEEALNQLLYLANIFTEDADCYYNLGIAYEKNKKFPLAKEAYLRALNLSGENIDCIYNLGMVSIELGEFDDAINFFNRVLEVEPNDSNTYFNLGIAYLKKGENFEALENFSKTVEINNQDYLAHFYIGNIFRETEQNELALKEFFTVLDIRPDYSWAYYNIASIYYGEGDVEQAIEYLKKTLEYNVNDIKACELLIKILVKNQQYDDAIDFLQSLTFKNEFNYDYYYLMARVFKEMGHLQYYADNLKMVLDNPDKITYPIATIQKEYDEIAQE